MDPLSVTSQPSDGLALIWEGQRWTFPKLASQVEAARGGLANYFGAESRVAIQATNRVETVFALLAMIEDGIPFVALHPRLTQSEATAMIADSDASFVLTDESIHEALAASCPARPAISPPPDRPLAMLYTSGTTGRRKAAVLQRSAFIASARASEQNLGWMPNDRWLLCMPICHVGGLSILTRCVMARRCVVLHSRFDAEAVLESIVRDEATLLSVVPTMLAGLLKADTRNILARLRVVLVGGAACPFPLLEECARRGISALTTYGLTETCSQVTAQSLRFPVVAESGSGRPLPGIEVAIHDPDGHPLPAGAVGGIHVHGPVPMQGYWKHAELRGWFDTGDMGALDEAGNLHVAARRTDLIVTGGENVYPSEVEQVLLTVPGVHEAIVFGTPDEHWGQVVSAALVASISLDDERLRSTAVAQLASFKRPRLLCTVGGLPTTSAGKPDRAAVRKQVQHLLRPW